MLLRLHFLYDCNYLSFRKHKKCLHSGGKAHFAFVKTVVQIAFYMIAIIFPASTPPPPSVANISGKDFSGALFIPKVPLETGAHQSFDASYAPASFTAWKIFTHFTDPIGSKGDHQQHYDFRLGR
jgi:hypothetical protein